MKVVGVRFRKAGKVYYFDPLQLDIKAGTNVIVETARGIEFGYVIMGIRDVPEEKICLPLKPVIRIATEEDMAVQKANAAKENKRHTILFLQKNDKKQDTINSRIKIQVTKITLCDIENS